MINVGIVGAEAAKFTPDTEAAARLTIRQIIDAALLSDPDGVTVVSGHCHLGGIDIWAEEAADALRLATLIFPPAALSWEAGYKPRNIQIAEASDIVHCIAIREYPRSYTGMKFASCYHCQSKDHIKSGGCWTTKYARRIGREKKLHIV